MIGTLKTAGSALLLGAAMMASPAAAATNLGFELGLTGWTLDATGPTDFTDRSGVVPPAVDNFGGVYAVPEGLQAAFVKGGAANVEIQLKQTLTGLMTGDKVTGWFGFSARDIAMDGVLLADDPDLGQAGDVLLVDDYGFVSIGGTMVKKIKVSDLSPFGDSGELNGGDGWIPFEWFAPSDGDFEIVLGSANVFQTSGLAVDNLDYSSTAFLDGVTVTLAPVPEPASWAMMVGGFFGLGMAMRGRARRMLATA